MALDRNPKNQDAFNRLGNVYLQLAKSKKGIEADALLGKAAENYEASLKIQRDNHEAFTNWGLVSFQRAQEKNREEAVSMLKEAIEKYGERYIKYKNDVPGFIPRYFRPKQTTY